MPRPVLMRLLALTVAVVAGLVTPLGAVTHGYAHLHEASHSSAIDDHAPSPPANHHDLAHLAFEDRHPDTDHLHQSVGTAVTTKSAASPVGVAPTPPTVAIGTTALVRPQHVVIEVVPRSTLSHAPPPRLRSPPPVRTNS